MKQDIFIKSRIRKQSEKRFGISAKDTIFNERKAGFIEGAEWYADNQWISVETKLPPINKEITYSVLSEHVFVRIDFEGNIMYRTACYDYVNKRWTVHSEFVTHWMLIPKLVK